MKRRHGVQSVVSASHANRGARASWLRAALVLANIAVVGVFASAVSLFYRHADIVEQPPIRQMFMQWHQQLVTGAHAAPYQWRILYAWVLEGLHRASGVHVLSLDKGLRIVIYYATLCGFWGYLRRWFDEAQSLVGTLFLAAIFPLALDVYNYYTPDYLNLLLFVIGFWLIRERRWSWLIPLVGLGTLNRETIVLLLIPLALYGRPDRGRRYWWTLGGCLVTFLAAYLGVRALYPRDHWMDYPLTANMPFLDMPRLLEVLKYNVKVLVIYGIFWVWPLLSYRRAPRFLRAAFWMVPAFVVVHYVVGSIREARLWLPLSVILIPLGLLVLFPARPSDGPAGEVGA